MVLFSVNRTSASDISVLYYHLRTEDLFSDSKGYLAVLVIFRWSCSYKAKLLLPTENHQTTIYGDFCFVGDLRVFRRVCTKLAEPGNNCRQILPVTSHQWQLQHLMRLCLSYTIHSPSDWLTNAAKLT